MNKTNINYSLYLVTDRSLSKERSTSFIVEAAVEGGVSCVQLREKNCSTREFIDEAFTLKKFLNNRNIPLIINDRIDVALVVNADGVHLGQDDMKIQDARRLLNSDQIIGISASSLEEAIIAEKEGADYIGISPVFPTHTKSDVATALGLEGIRLMNKNINIPLVGIGGININNCANVISNGAQGIAVVSAIVSADDPRIAAEKLKATAFNTLFKNGTK